MHVEIVGKFFDNHSLSIVNRNIALNLMDSVSVSITPIDSPNPENKLSVSVINRLMDIRTKNQVPSIQIRHSYPILWRWPEYVNTQVVYIQPWEFMAMPSEWQYKFDTFADAVITPSNWTAEVYKNAGIDPSKIHVIPNGYDPEVFNQEDRPTNKDKINFVFVGCYQFRKGLDILLDVWSKITKHDQAIRLIIKDTPQIYGKTTLQQDVIKLQYNTNCAEIVYDDSVKSEAEMSSLYKSADFIVHPYRGEGFGVHIQEAMACGAVPIVTAGGPTDEFVKDFRISSGTRLVNMQEIFAIKPGDSLSLMGQHKWVLEPSREELARAIKYVLETPRITVDTSNLTTWTDVADKYAVMLEKINGNVPQRVR